MPREMGRYQLVRPLARGGMAEVFLARRRAGGLEKLLVIKLGKGKLTVTAVTLQEINAQGYTVSDYSPALAAQSYLRHGAGVTEKARKFLEKIATSEFSDRLTFTCSNSDLI